MGYQRTEDGSQKSENRGQMLEVGSRNAEVGIKIRILANYIFYLSSNAVALFLVIRLLPYVF